MIPKINKKILVKSHIRKGRSVRSHFREVERNIDEPVSLKSWQDSYDSIYDRIFDKDGFIRDTVLADDLNKAVFDLFGSLHGVDQDVINFPEIQDIVFEKQNSNVIGSKKFRLSKYSFFESIFNKDNVKKIIGFVDDLEKKFRSKFNVETERVDPFTFSFNVERKSGSIYKLVSDEKFMKKISDFYGDFGLDFINNEKLFYNLVSGFLYNKNKFKGIAQSVLVDNILRVNDIKFNSVIYNKFNWSKFDPFRVDLDDLNQGSIYVGDGEKIRQALVEELNQCRKLGFCDDDEYNKIVSHFKKLDAGSVGAHFTLFMNSGSLMSDSKIDAFNKGIKKLSEYIDARFKQAESSDNKQSGKIFISKNPLNIFTMSDHKHVVSCQSILCKQGKFLDVHVDRANINIPGAAFGHMTNDFIMYVVDNNGNKVSRISLNENKDGNFVNFEDMKIYGDDHNGRHLIKDFISDNKDKFGVAGNNMRGLISWTGDTQNKFSKVYSIFIESIKIAKNSERARSYIGSFLNEFEKSKSVLYNRLLDEFDDYIFSNVNRQKSLLYNSDGYFSYLCAESKMSVIHEKVREIDNYKKLY